MRVIDRPCLDLVSSGRVVVLLLCWIHIDVLSRVFISIESSSKVLIFLLNYIGQCVFKARLGSQIFLGGDGAEHGEGKISNSNGLIAAVRNDVLALSINLITQHC
jgi:hypothetical protein